MRQFDVFPNPSPRSRIAVPFVVLMQSHFVREPRSGDFTRVSVAVQVDGETLHLSLAEMAPIWRSELKRSVGHLRDSEDDIRRALDRLFTGF